MEIVGGEPGPLVDRQMGDPAARSAIGLRRERIGRLLGVSIADDEVTDYLQRLGMTLTADEAGWQVVPPACRFDVHIEADLIEEIGRLYGYDRIPTTLPRLGMSLPTQPAGCFDLNAAKQRLTALGYQEVISYSFIEPQWCQQLSPGATPVPLANPISADMSVMRTSLWPGLIQAAQHNMARRRTRLRLFESGLQFSQQGEEIEQPPMLAALMTGEVQAEQWGDTSRAVDFFDMKADAEAILAMQAPEADFSFEAEEHPALHPGQSARILRDGKALGWLGMLHPEKAKALNVDQDVYLLELNLQALDSGDIAGFTPLSKYPWIRRDIALVVDKDVSFSAVEKTIRQQDSEFLKDILLFDVYTGERIDSGRKSLALGLILQDSSRTLTDQEVDAYLAAVVERLALDLGARLRD
jgi:phenylalanyl-tRNA synthetase beta chain